jgi:hypothetical protein
MTKNTDSEMTNTLGHYISDFFGNKSFIKLTPVVDNALKRGKWKTLKFKPGKSIGQP